MEGATSNNLLLSYQVLVYLEDTSPTPEVDGYTYIARKVRSYFSDNKLWHDVILLTDSTGNKNKNKNHVTISNEKIISERPVKDIKSNTFIHFAPLVFIKNIKHPITATNFVIKTNKTRPLESTTRTGFGTGIYGRFVDNIKDISSLSVHPSQTVYEITCENPYFLQDKEHGDSLITASMGTNRYLDNIINVLRNSDEISLEMIIDYIYDYEPVNIFMLWNIMLYRTREYISREDLYYLFASYVMNYLFDNSLNDSVTKLPITELPINSIMKYLGHDGILADDPYNNGWGRGCVSYNHEQAIIMQGDQSRY